jgi:hypothetical protein
VVQFASSLVAVTVSVRSGTRPRVAFKSSFKYRVSSRQTSSCLDPGLRPATTFAISELEYTLSYRAVASSIRVLEKLYMSVNSEVDELEDDLLDTSPVTDSPASPFDMNVPLSTVTAAKKPRRFAPETKVVLQRAHLPTR